MARILLAEDDPDVGMLVQEALEEAGHRVHVAVDGDSALQALRTFRPDLVVTDILMPKRGGLELIREIRRGDGSLPIIAVSGGGSTGKLNFLQSAAQFPAVATLRKPFTPSQLLAVVTGSLARRA